MRTFGNINMKDEFQSIAGWTYKDHGRLQDIIVANNLFYLLRIIKVVEINGNKAGMSYQGSILTAVKDA